MKAFFLTLILFPLLFVGCKKADTNSNTGYICSNGNCQISSNPQFVTYADCQTGCSSSGGTGGYKCNSGTCVAVSSNAQYSTYSNCYNACGSHTQYGGLVVAGSPSCSGTGSSYPSISFTLSGVMSSNLTWQLSGSHTYSSVATGIVTYHATETCTSNVRDGNVQIIAGQTAYITVNF